MTTMLLTLGLFASFMAAMAVGLILSGRILQGSCGGLADHDELSCGSCAKKEADVCPTDDPLVRLAQIAHPDPAHHR